MVSQLKHKASGGIDKLRPPETNTRINARSFFVNNRRRFNLSSVLSEYETEKGVIEDYDVKERNESQNENPKSLSITPKKKIT